MPPSAIGWLRKEISIQRKRRYTEMKSSQWLNAFSTGHRVCWKYFRDICEILEVWAEAGVKQWHRVYAFSKKVHSVPSTFYCSYNTRNLVCRWPLILCHWPLAPGYSITKYLLQSLTKSKSKSRIKPKSTSLHFNHMRYCSLIIPLHRTLNSFILKKVCSIIWSRNV